MPGGLARIASDMAAEVVSNQRGGGSKDVWVIATPDITEESDVAALERRRRARNEDLPSRLVENLFWMGRYADRCDAKARLIRASLALDSRSEAWRHAMHACTQFGVLAESADLAASLFDTSNGTGLGADLRRLEWSATQARSRLSAEHWRAIGVLQRQFHEAASSRNDARETLTQDDGWRLLMLGRRLERVQFLTTLLALRLCVAPVPTRYELEWWLDISGGTIAYRTQYLEQARLTPVLHLLIRDAQNARGLVFQCAEIRRALAQMTSSGGLAAPEEFFDRAVSEVAESDFGVLEGVGYTAVAARQSFAQRLTALNDAATQLSDRLSMRHFSHTERDVHVVAT
jgi:uncharacterized alpha-E superfamily protein